MILWIWKLISVVWEKYAVEENNIKYKQGKKVKTWSALSAKDNIPVQVNESIHKSEFLNVL